MMVLIFLIHFFSSDTLFILIEKIKQQNQLELRKEYTLYLFPFHIILKTLISINLHYFLLNNTTQ